MCLEQYRSAVGGVIRGSELQGCTDLEPGVAAVTGLLTYSHPFVPIEMDVLRAE